MTRNVSKAIIIAAGMGKRMNHLTVDKPKCLLDIEGKSIMERQIETLRLCGINDIAVIRGYQGGKINFSNLDYYENSDYQNNNILNSLFCAEPAMSEDFIVSYSDILYDQGVVKKLLEDQHDIAVIVDTDWREYYQGRIGHPTTEAEKVILENDRVVKIGKKIGAEGAAGEFIGLAKFSGQGVEMLKQEFQRVKDKYAGKPFHEAVIFEKAYLTDMFQELIDRGADVYPVLIQKNWWEMDTAEDLEKVRKIFKGRKIINH